MPGLETQPAKHSWQRQITAQTSATSASADVTLVQSLCIGQEVWWRGVTGASFGNRKQIHFQY